MITQKMKTLTVLVCATLGVVAWTNNASARFPHHEEFSTHHPGFLIHRVNLGGFRTEGVVAHRASRNDMVVNSDTGREQVMRILDRTRGHKIIIMRSNRPSYILGPQYHYYIVEQTGVKIPGIRGYLAKVRKYNYLPHMDTLNDRGYPAGRTYYVKNTVAHIAW